MRETKKIWMNGELIDWADATVHVGTHGLHYGTGVFEGIRAYETDRGTSVFRLTEHLERLHRSAQLLYMEIPYSVEELRAATWDLIGANELPTCYLRPIAFYGYGELGVHTGDNPVEVVIMSWPWGSYLGEEGQKQGIRAMVSSWQRVGPNVIPHVAKATGVYLNSMLAVHEANRAGYDEAILLSGEGYVADGSGESIFVVRDGVIYTPDLSASILVGITRDTVIQIAQDLGHRVVEKPMIRSDLYLADEVFMVGTAAEVTPIREVDDQVIGPPGPVTREIQEAYLDTVHGRSDRWSQWLEFAPPSAAASGAGLRPGVGGSADDASSQAAASGAGLRPGVGGSADDASSQAKQAS
jgi:branched-chain amino acid aminotransferase